MPSSGHTSASVAWTAEGSSGPTPRAPGRRPRRAAPRGRPAHRGHSASSVSPGSATIASPIGARAASSGSDVMATSAAPSGSSGPGMFGVVGEHRRARHEHEVVAGRARRPGPIAGGRTPRKAAWSSGKPSRPPPGAGVAHTGSRCVRPARPRRPRRRRRPRRGRRPARGSSPPPAGRPARATAPGRPARGRSPLRRVWCATAASSTSASQSSIGIETNVGPRGGSAARCAARAIACGTSSARGGS